MKVFKPWVFQGSTRYKRYFEGWYFKHVSADQKEVWSMIPGISLSPERQHAFVQVLNGISGEVWIFEYDISAFRASGSELHIELGDSVFSSGGIQLDLQNETTRIAGEIAYSGIEHYPSSRRNPGIMGWYSFVPFMECKHGIYSMRHTLNGGFELNGNPVALQQGTGYIEKDWGKSFPESWVWLHCNTFENSAASFTISVAKIPWLGSYFIGFISYLHIPDRFYNFSTWSKARIETLSSRDGLLDIHLRNKEYQLRVQAENKQAGKLKAPVRGSMERIIKETVDADLELSLLDSSGKTIFQDRGHRAGMELIDPILSYFK